MPAGHPAAPGRLSIGPCTVHPSVHGECPVSRVLPSETTIFLPVVIPSITTTTTSTTTTYHFHHQNNPPTKPHKMDAGYVPLPPTPTTPLNQPD